MKKAERERLTAKYEAKTHNQHVPFPLGRVQTSFRGPLPETKLFKPSTSKGRTKQT